MHGVALKPGKPLCLAVAGGKPIAVLPGFPTSAIFTFHAFVAPVIRARAGLAPEAADKIEARVPVRIPSELGRQEFVLVSLVAGEAGPVAFPSQKGSGAVTSFSEADGFIEIDALAPALDADTSVEVTLIGKATRPPDLVIMGSHCVALDVVLGKLAEAGFTARKIAIGSQGGVIAARRGECDLAPVHLMDPASGIYNEHLVENGISLVPGWQRMQGFVHRPDDKRFKGKSAQEALKAALADPACLMVNRNAGAGTRVLIDQLLAGARRGLRQPAALAQRGRRGGGARPRRLGDRDRDRSRASTASASCRSRPSNTISCWWRNGTTGRRCRRFWPPCTIPRRAKPSVRWACGPRATELGSAHENDARDRARRLERRRQNHADDPRDPGSGRARPPRLHHQARPSRLRRRHSRARIPTPTGKRALRKCSSPRPGAGRIFTNCAASRNRTCRIFSRA